MSRWNETPNTLADAARPPFKALILTTQTGGGHWAVADALCTAFALGYGDRFQAEAIDLWAEHTAWPLNQLPKTYRPMVASTPSLWGRIFYKSQARRVVRLGMRAAWPFAQRGVREALLAHAPDVIVAVHPLLQEIPLRILAELGWDVPFVTVVTDLATAHPAWFQRRAALCLAPTDEVRRLALRAGLRPDQVIVTGLPIRPAFARVAGSKADLRRRLGLAPDRPTALVIGGADGVGDLAAVVRAAATALADPATIGGQLVVVCGRNRALESELRAAAWPAPVTVLGFVSDLWTWMAACDCVITKAGPTTIAEALAQGLPLLLSGRVPGQEEGNVAYVLAGGAGLYADTPEGVAATLARWFGPDRAELTALSERARRMGRADAALRAVERIAALAAHGQSTGR